MKTKEINELSVNELIARGRELKDQLFHLRIQKVSGQVEKPSQFRLIRKDIARIETVLSAKRAAAANAAAK